MLQYFAIYKSTNFLNRIAKEGSKFCQILNKAFKNYQRCLKCYQFGGIWSHWTLLTYLIPSIIQFKIYRDLLRSSRRKSTILAPLARCWASKIKTVIIASTIASSNVILHIAYHRLSMDPCLCGLKNSAVKNDGNAVVESSRHNPLISMSCVGIPFRHLIKIGRLRFSYCQFFSTKKLLQLAAEPI